jgi:hypothetical protein
MGIIGSLDKGADTNNRDTRRRGMALQSAPILVKKEH